MPGVARLLLVRHGQSEWNAAGRWQGQADPPLTALGRAQATVAARMLGPVRGVHASTLQRAQQTAGIIAAHHDLEPVGNAPGLVERDAGAWTGRTRAEIEELWPGALEAWRIPDDMEDDATVLARARTALVELATAVGSGKVLVVTHGGVIGTVARSLGASDQRYPNLTGIAVDVHDTVFELRGPVSLTDDEAVEVTLPDVQ